MRIKLLFFSFVLLLFSCGKSGRKPSNTAGPTVDPAYNKESFKDPLLDNGNSPAVLQKDGYYYYVQTTGDNITLYKLTKMSYLRFAYSKVIYIPIVNMNNSNNLSAPEIHYLNGKWYIYYAADNGFDANHRLFVLENSSPDPSTGTWISKKIAGTADIYANDPTILENNGENYLIWSGWETAQASNTGKKQQLYIEKMTDPLTITGNRVLISSPTNSWEEFAYQAIVNNVTVVLSDDINEAPAILKNAAGDVFLTFSASSCASDNYCLGMLSLKKSGDPLNPGDWTKNSSPVFAANGMNNVYGPGHNSFFKSIDGKEDWLIYDANSRPGLGCGETRNPRMQKVTWKTDGTPDFGIPVEVGLYITKPSGE